MQCALVYDVNKIKLNPNIRLELKNLVNKIKMKFYLTDNKFSVHFRSPSSAHARSITHTLARS